MVSKQEYNDIQERILSIVEESNSPVAPTELLERVRDDYGVPRELGSAVLWEMIRAGYIDRSEDWRVSYPGRKVGMPV